MYTTDGVDMGSHNINNKMNRDKIDKELKNSR